MSVSHLEELTDRLGGRPGDLPQVTAIILYNVPPDPSSSVPGVPARPAVGGESEHRVNVINTIS